MRPLQVNPLVIPDLLAPAHLAASSELRFLLRLLIAAVLAGILGWERESAHKPAGLRTHMVVGIASALFTALGELALQDQAATAESVARGDPVRVIQAVAVGIGFLGSGVIFVAREGDRVRGLTTAASIWATAGVGIAAGSGRFVLAGGSTILLMLVLRVMARFDRDA
ncbi:MAG TPA: MgtC/SapB family protein [Gemmatimonadales bacterium]|nr:MgtC/SapB family protein [Gemmatimonadales bacterium]